ncbi:hypothetical protein FA15DRAFT_740301 [Coprinopsis marcescibilis]|uniref:PIN domain-containing protein n=1 Tax=Coprinopsis marcescibilis TaxID=230819 RepID=A0A5C3L9A3_COPMA|nr:hypothetical protein FA15DRAFT_740301 [Coprinopsis marcescibilis]
MIIDTNILMHHYEAIRTFVEDVERVAEPVVVVVPGIVIYELDGLKKRNEAWPARRASGWLLSKVREQKHVKVQATDETTKPSRNWRTKDDEETGILDEMKNDRLILDCCQYFRSKHHRTVLCSADKNLCIIATTSDARNPVMSISPPPGRPWTSREIMKTFFGEQYHLLSQFRTSNSAYEKKTKTQSEDLMQVDDEVFNEQPLNTLHDDVRVHFTRLLLEAAVRIGGTELKKGCDPAKLSRHAAGWQRKHYSTWTAGDCLEYLSYERSEIGRVAEEGQPRLAGFLTKRYEGQGARTGREWSTADWRRAAEKLERIGRILGDGGIEQAVRDLRPYLDLVLPLIL